jgi:hypothetical protein
MSGSGCLGSRSAGSTRPYLDFVASPHTFRRAKVFLVTQGVLEHGTVYQVA